MTGVRAGPAPAPVLGPLPRPSLRVRPEPGRRSRTARLHLVKRAAAVHAAVTGGRLHPRVLAALDRLLPPSPLPDLQATLADGVRLRLDGAGALARIALLCAGYEHRECEVLAGALRPGGVFVDVGANVGWFSMAVAAHRPSSTVWAVEPLPATADRLAANVAAAELAHVVVHRVLLGAAAGTAELVATVDSAFAHVSGAGRTTRTGRREPTVACPVTTLDRLWAAAGRPRVDAVKIDVEGAEPEVLAGAGTLLRACGPVLVVEAPTAAYREVLDRAAQPLGYRQVACPGVLPYNSVLMPVRSG
jgi:FkbM family methyltransferase